MSVLDDFLSRLGIKSLSDLTAEERETYERWQEALSAPKLTVADVEAFAREELARCDEALRDYAMPEQRRVFTQATARLCAHLVAMLTAPERQKLQVQAQIEQLSKRSPPSNKQPA